MGSSSNAVLPCETQSSHFSVLVVLNHRGESYGLSPQKNAHKHALKILHAMLGVPRPHEGQVKDPSKYTKTLT